MATYTYINGDMPTLKSVLDGSGYFDSVTYDNTDGEVITCYVGQLAMLTITKTLGTGTQKGYSWAVQGAVPSWTSTVSPSSNPANEPQKAYQCSGGLILHLYQASGGSITSSNARVIVITKNNNNVTTIAFYDAGSTPYNSAIGAIAATDTGAYSKVTITQSEYFSQTLLVPVCSCAGFDALSYTPTVKRTVNRQSSVFGFIEYNNKRYLYDGYFAVEDTQSSGGAS